jgi:hypothetical protein
MNSPIYNSNNSVPTSHSKHCLHYEIIALTENHTTISTRGEHAEIFTLTQMHY